MEQEAKKLLADTKRNLLSKKEAVKVKSEFVAEKGNPDGELENLEKEASEFDQIRKMTEQDIEVCKKQIADRKEAQDKSTELLQSTDTAKQAVCYTHQCRRKDRDRHKSWKRCGRALQQPYNSYVGCAKRPHGEQRN